MATNHFLVISLSVSFFFILYGKPHITRTLSSYRHPVLCSLHTFISFAYTTFGSPIARCSCTLSLLILICVCYCCCCLLSLTPPTNSPGNCQRHRVRSPPIIKHHNCIIIRTYTFYTRQRHRTGAHEEKEASKSGTDDGNTPGQPAHEGWRQVALEDQER